MDASSNVDVLKPQPTRLAPGGNCVLTWRPAPLGGLSCWVVQPAPGAVPTGPVLVAVRGERMGARQTAMALGKRAAKQGRVVIAPCFDEESWRGYERMIAPRRADLALLTLLDDLQVHGVGDTSRFDLFGYSGGAQFAHRFAWLHPWRVCRLIAAAADCYTFPDSAPYPYGTGAGVHGRWGARLAKRLPQFLQVQMHVLVAKRDRVGDAPLHRDALRDAQQGTDRLARARAWVRALHRQAVTHGIRSQIQLTVLPDNGRDVLNGVRHDELADQALRPPGRRSSYGQRAHDSCSCKSSSMVGDVHSAHLYSGA